MEQCPRPLRAYVAAGLCSLLLPCVVRVAGGGAAELEWPREWVVVGPLKRKHPVLPVEVLRTVPTRVTVLGAELRARAVRAEAGRFDFGRLFGGHAEGDTAYAFARLRVAQDTTLLAGASADWWMQWWLDGNPVYDTLTDGNECGMKGPADHVFRLSLSKGEHVLAVRVISGSASFRMVSGAGRELAEGLAPLLTHLPRLRQSKRPRLFLTPAMVEGIRQTMTDDRRRYLAALVKQVDAYRLDAVVETQERVYGSRNDRGTPAANAALVYLLTGDNTYLAKAKTLLENSINWYHQRFERGEPVDWYSTSRIGALCAFDWIHDALSPSERRALGRRLLDHVRQCQSRRTRPKLEGPSGPTQGFYGVANLKWYAGLVFLDAAVDDGLASRYLFEGYRDHTTMFEYRARAANDDGGSATACVGYAGSGAYQRQELKFFHSWFAATGENYAERYPGLAMLPNWLLWNAIPSMDGSIREFGFGDSWHRDNRWRPGQVYLAQVGHFYGSIDPALRDIAANLLVRSRTAPLHRTFLYNDQAVFYLLFDPPADTDRVTAPPPGLPRARHFPALGQIIMNSGWDPYATHCLFIGGSTRAGHKHYDENHFTIYKQGYLALDSGTRSASGQMDEAGLLLRHVRGYYMRSVAHNCILIQMQDETDFPLLRALDKQHWSNDGGMNTPVGSKILAFETNRHFTYVASDATACYSSGKCAEAVRQFVFLMPDIFVVFDRVTTQRADQQTSWLFHSQNEPAIRDNVVTAVEDTGTVACRTLLPSPCRLGSVGGAGQEFLVDGRTHALPAERASEPGRGVLYGQWRVEVRPATPGCTHRFLHLLQVGHKNALAEPVPGALCTEPGRRGVDFRAGPYRARLLFNESGDVGGRIRLGLGDRLVYDRALTAQVQEQAGLALDPDAKARPGPVWTGMRQGDKRITNHERTLDLAPVTLQLQDVDAVLDPVWLRVATDGYGRKDHADVRLSADRHTAEIVIDAAGLCRSLPVRERDRQLLRTLLVTYREPLSGKSARFSRRFRLPAGKPHARALFLTDLKPTATVVTPPQGSLKWFNEDGDYRGNPLTIGLEEYNKGLFLLPPKDKGLLGSIEYVVPADRSTGTFKSVIGIHYTAWGFGSVVFRVKLSSGPDAPWELAYAGPCLGRDGGAIELAVPLGGACRLRLECDAGSDVGSDYAVWANARIE